MDNANVTTLRDLLDAFLVHGRTRNFRARTMDSYRAECARFLDWLEARHGVVTADRLRRSQLDAWLRHLAEHRTPRGLPLTVKTMRMRIAVLRTFLKYLAVRGYILGSLPDALVAPREPQTLPLSVLTHAQVKKLLRSVHTDTPQGIRDRAILELLYTSGMRAAEIIGLDVADVDLHAGTAKVEGKGGKERVVPIGRSALRWVESYIQGVRPFVTIDEPDEQALFINYQGTRLKYGGLRRMVHVHADRLGFDVTVSPHTFRRSCTTELIRGGANMYHVKELLGHESLEMLKPYTKLTIRDLKKTHERTHPRERDERS